MVGSQGLPVAVFVMPEEKVELVQGAYGLGFCNHLGGQGFHMVDDGALLDLLLNLDVMHRRWIRGGLHHHGGVTTHVNVGALVLI